MEKVLNMTYASSLTNLCEVNTSFDTGVLRICYTGKNRNNSSISRQAIENSIQTIYNCPIVCNYDRESDTLGGHDMELVRTDDGGLKIVNCTQPIGCVPESARTWFEDYEEEDGTVHEYLYAEVLLWKRQEAYAKIKRDGITAHSMEITVKDGMSVDGVYQINDFQFTAFALIGVEPCFEASALEVFSKADFKQQLSEMMQDLKETYSMVGSSNEDNDTNSQTYSMEGGQKTLEEKMKLVAQYGIDVDALDFSLDDFSVEELAEKFEAMTKQEPEDKHDEDFGLNSNVVDELHRVLGAEMVACDWGERPRYCYADCDMDAGEVYGWDTGDWLLYGFTFSVNGDAVAIDFDSKKRKKYSIVDFEGAEQDSTIAPVFALMEDKLGSYAEMTALYAAAQSTIESMKSELEELREFKAEADTAIAQGEREELLAQFQDLNGIEAFDALCEHCLDYDLETLEEKCYAIRGRNGSSAKFSMRHTKAPKLKVDKPDNENEPYGGLFMKYGRNGSN